MSRTNYAPVTATIIEELQKICGEKHVIFSDDQALQKYSHDQVPQDKYARMPEVAVLPKTGLEISAILKLANREKIPVTPRAAGSGLSGGAVPIYGGILLSVERMNKILEIDPSNMMAVVEPGVVTNKFDQALKGYGLFFAGYPMSEEFCYIAGNVAENAGGGRAIKYGVTGRYIRGLEVVTPLKNPAHSKSQWDEIIPEILRDIYVATAALGGTISGEHGIGHKRRDYMRLVVSDVQLDIMQKIKLAFDPNNILNPGKIISIT